MSSQFDLKKAMRIIDNFVLRFSCPELLQRRRNLASYQWPIKRPRGIGMELGIWNRCDSNW